MSKFIITGGKKLQGRVSVPGSKNALFPLMAACLLTEEECVLTNVPQISDREIMCELLQDLGAKVQSQGSELVITAGHLAKSDLDAGLSGKLRGSIVLLGALLSRLGRASMNFPGGDLIGKRPVSAHLAAFEGLGAHTAANGRIELEGANLHGAKIVLEESSVTATENAILAASLAPGRTEIRLAATEPHIQQLCEFINLMGGQISGIGTASIIIEGVQKLHGARIRMIPDSTQAAGFIVLAAATKSDITVADINPDVLDDFLLKLSKMNVSLEIGPDFAHVRPPVKDYAGIKIQSGLYPKLASDDIPPMAVLATQAHGETIIHEWMYENRQGYAKELAKMGAEITVLDSDRVRIVGPTSLKCAKMESLDIRMGMTMVIAALVASGECEIAGIEHIDRGYEKLEERLQALGADIKRID